VQRASRRTQPYRKGSGRQAGRPLRAMLAGKPVLMQNPQDVKREMQRRFHKRKRLRDRIRS